MADCITAFLKATNVRERDYHKETEYIIDFATDVDKVQSVQVLQTPMTLPNGNLIMIPSDLYFFFECQSLKDASPLFISSVGIINTCADDVNINDLIHRQLKLIEKKHAPFFKEFKVKMTPITRCVEEFLIPFIKKLDT